MSKKQRREPAEKIEIQKGPINLDEQYSYKFRREPEFTIRDMEENRMRRDKMTLTLHTPKQ